MKGPFPMLSMPSAYFALHLKIGVFRAGRPIWTKRPYAFF